MEGYFPLKMKRKDFEDVTDDFSDFPLSSPATKIRRLDVGFPPIIEEEEREIPVKLEQSRPQEPSFCCSKLGGLKIEELPNVPENEERAIVLFKPIGTAPLLQSSSNFSVDPHLVSELRNRVLRPSQTNSWRLANDEVVTEDGDSGSGNQCQAVIPWVPPRYLSADGAGFSSEIDNGEMMDAEEVGEATMDVEDSIGSQHGNSNGADKIFLSEGLHQWQQQQHCMIPQPPQNVTTPIFWYR